MRMSRVGYSDYWYLLFVGFLFSVTMVESVYAAEDLAAKEKALHLIADVADRICTDIPLKGGKEKLELSGNARAELSGLIKKLADLGMRGAAKYEKSEYEGVLQEDLVKALKTSADCKLEIFRELKSQLLR